MNIQDTPDAFDALLQSRGLSTETAPLDALVASLAAFFDSHKPSGLADYAGDEDMLMAEWHPPFRAPGFEVLLVRQFISADGAIHQLQITRTYAAPPADLKVPGSSGWQMTGAGLVEATQALVAAVGDTAAQATKSGLQRA